jgi:Flp pilus assembly CpaF family ATPase
VECGNCLRVCPRKPKDYTIFDCDQCNECVRKCGAFRETARGVYTIDEAKCTKCGDCRKACDKGVTAKCDLCLECITACPISALALEHTDEEERLLDEVLGWRKAKGEYETGLYEPSADEARLMREVLEAFRETDEALEETLDEYISEERLAIGESQRGELLRLLTAEALGYSALDPLVKDGALEEITVANGRVRVYRRGAGWQDADVEFTTETKVVDLINRMARPLGRRVTLRHPRVNAMLNDGSRLHAAIPPVVKSPCLTIRKFTEKPFTPDELVRHGLIAAQGMQVLEKAVREDSNIMIAGSTGSGKTTTLNALCTLIPLDQRIIIVEETPEISVPHEHCVRLVVNEELGVTMDSLVADTLRMRPDKLIVGEVRDEKEVKALMNTMLAGQGKGSLCTFHALTAREAIARLRALGAREADLNALHYIAIQRRVNENGKEVRVITEISGVRDGELRNFYWRSA